jgi:histidyl-tRNA synthetase
MERLLLLLETLDLTLENSLDVYFICFGEKTVKTALCLAEQLRNALPNLKIQLDCTGSSLKSQFKKADKSGARYALILGEDEVMRSEIRIKSLRDEHSIQQAMSFDRMAVFLSENL